MSTAVATPVTGSPRIWARDMALFGGLTSAVVPLLLIDFAPTHYWLVAGALGALTGGAPRGGDARVARADAGEGPAAAPVLDGVPIGGVWGALVGGLAGVPYVVMS
ncbi:MAG: hypothetical protein GY913_16960 [Proteobacteria bacterium]|nr:hypothetical protein [Pseudomonadota bacterium]MCP4918595.1 hypothetical protein [Pseudomonadota bacterium]